MIRKFAFLIAFVYRIACRRFAAEVGGVKLDDKMSVGGQELVLNGAGIRTKVMFKVYVGSLYVPAKANTAAAVYAKAPRRVQLNMLRDVGADQMVEALVDGVKQANSAGGRGGGESANRPARDDHEVDRSIEGRQCPHLRFRRRRDQSRP